jgi:malate synthase
LVAEKESFSVGTADVDAEIAQIAGPQLVVPVSNARYALNAANARWGSLYDALYGTDAIPLDGAPRGTRYNPQRGAKVIRFARDFLDQHFPLAKGSHRDATGYRPAAAGLEVALNDGTITGLKSPEAFRGFQGDSPSPGALLLQHHGLHVELHIDKTHTIGRDDAAGISDVVLESAITTIQDCEDSVTAVDTADKIHV